MKTNNWIKEFFKKHNKEIIIGIASVAATSIYFLIKQSKINGGIDLRLHIGNEYDWNKRSRFSTYVNLNDQNVMVKDLGSLGERIIKIIPKCTNETPIKNINIDFSGICEEV